MAREVDHRDPWLAEVEPNDLRRIIDALYRVHQFISYITDLDTLLERIMDEGKQVANAEACSLMLHDAATEELYFHVALGESGDQQTLKREVRLRLDEGIAGAAATRRESVNVADAQQDSRFYRGADLQTHFETRAVLAVPLVDRGELIGVIEVLNKVGGGGFSETDRHVMEMFSALTATVIANARLIEQNLRAERLAALGQAVAGMAHHTKNIIAGMTSSVDLIDQGLATDNREFLHKSWPVFKRSTKRISHFVEDMLAFSKPRHPLRSECDMRRIIEDAVETFQGLLVVKKVELTLDLDGMNGPVFLDPRGIYSCILNLLTNAADAVPREGGRIDVAARPGKDGRLIVEIADNGPGVDPEQREKIFDPFFSTKGSQGTGLGLAVTRKVIAEHGGGIEVTDGPLGGALFRIELPAAPTQ